MSSSKPPVDILPPLIHTIGRAFASMISTIEIALCKELFKWMVSLKALAEKSASKEIKKPGKKSAAFIVNSSDDSMDKVIDYEEPKDGFQRGHVWNQTDIMSGGHFMTKVKVLTLDFVDRVVRWSDSHNLSDWLPDLDRDALINMFNKYASQQMILSLSLVETLVDERCFTGTNEQNRNFVG